MTDNVVYNGVILHIYLHVQIIHSHLHYNKWASVRARIIFLSLLNIYVFMVRMTLITKQDPAGLS